MTAAVAILVTSCSSGTGTDTAPPAQDPGLAHVHGLGVDPGDGMLYAATHYGVFRVPPTGEPTRIAGRHQDTMGFTVVGPRHFLASGHPDFREDLPTRLGLIESTDAAQTWTIVSLGGEADFHALRAAHGVVFGYDAGSGKLLVSRDKKAWVPRAELQLYDFAVSPADADIVLAGTPDGLARSTTGGRGFVPVPEAPPVVFFAWPAADVLFGLTVSGTVVASGDGGLTWQERGRVEGRPAALAAADDTTLYAATEHGIFASTDAGRTFTTRYVHH